jgi:hypothetical protein
MLATPASVTIASIGMSCGWGWMVSSWPRSWPTPMVSGFGSIAARIRVIVAAAVAEPEASAIEADQRYQERGWPHDLPFCRDRDVPDAAAKRRPGVPSPELERLLFLDHDGERGTAAPLDEPADQRVRTDLAPERPVEPQKRVREVRKMLLHEL